MHYEKTGAETGERKGIERALAEKSLDRDVLGGVIIATLKTPESFVKSKGERDGPSLGGSCKKIGGGPKSTISKDDHEGENLDIKGFLAGELREIIKELESTKKELRYRLYNLKNSKNR